MNIVILRPAVEGKDEPRPPSQYKDLINKLYDLRPKDFQEGFTALAAELSAEQHCVEFSDAARIIRQQQEAKHIKMADTYASINKMLSGHVGKFKGMFARYCLLFHCIETVDAPSPEISADVARRVAEFMNDYLLQHAIAFYIGTVGMSDDNEILIELAGYILANKLARLSTRDIARGSTLMRSLDKRETERVCEQLEAYGWLTRKEGRRYLDVVWEVNPEVHHLFAAKAAKEKEERDERRALLLSSIPKSIPK